MGSFKNWWNENEVSEWLHVASVAIAALTIMYFILWLAYTGISWFLGVTGLTWIIAIIAGAACGNTVMILLEEYRVYKNTSQPPIRE